MTIPPDILNSIPFFEYETTEGGIIEVTKYFHERFTMRNDTWEVATWSRHYWRELGITFKK